MRSSFLLVCLTFTSNVFGVDTLDAPNMNAEVIDQVPVHAMACGPIALFNAYQLSSVDWRASIHRISGSPQEKFNYFTKTYCSRFSRNTYMKKRWDEKNGIRPDDLAEAVNELHKKAKLPTVSLKRLFLKNKQSHRELLVELHGNISSSINHGFPPLLTVSKFGRLQSPSGGYRWAVLSSHFITITSIPKELEGNAHSFSFSYVDPWRAQKKNSRFTTSETTFFANDITNRKDKKLHKNPTLVMPKNSIGLGVSRVRSNIAQAIAVTHLIIADSAPATLIKAK
ncbi:MAG: hypothetical protein ABGY95_08015 [Rubritalea sp.]|uniref:hypothetical protein n=1 Tax=Rubritalea sp. TaxID=2109375 RepID=UPI0032423DE7